jgi:hypothetical protein
MLYTQIIHIYQYTAEYAVYFAFKLLNHLRKVPSNKLCKNAYFLFH